MAKGSLKYCVIAVTGFFGSERPLNKLKDWIQHQDGVFAVGICPKVTHLICSKEHFKQNVQMVRDAKNIQGIKIVSYDWLEDCCIEEKRFHERKYLMHSRIKNAMETKLKKKAIRNDNIKKGSKFFSSDILLVLTNLVEDFEKGCKDFEKDMFASGYHIYHDPTMFAYDVTLARVDLLHNKNERWTLKVCKPYPHLPNPPPIVSTLLYPIERLLARPRAFVVSARAQRLQLYESHATPKLYACYTKYSAPNMPGKAEICAPIGSSFELAFESFVQFFELKTRRKWSERLLKSIIEDGAFSYTAPKHGEPKGVVEEEENSEVS